MTPIARSALFVSLLSSAANADTWIGGGVGNDWTTAANWSASNVPNAVNEAALFTNDPVGQTKLSPNLPADVTIGQLQFSATAEYSTWPPTPPSTLTPSPSVEIPPSSPTAVPPVQVLATFLALSKSVHSPSRSPKAPT